jgi:hypothetical protein
VLRSNKKSFDVVQGANSVMDPLISPRFPQKSSFYQPRFMVNYKKWTGKIF